MTKIVRIYVQTHSRDCHDFAFTLDNGETIEMDGYNVGVLGSRNGDDLSFEVDNETGMILNWKPISTSILGEEYEIE